MPSRYLVLAGKPVTIIAVALRIYLVPLQKALEQTAEKTVGLQPLVTQLSKAVQEASMDPASNERNGTQIIGTVEPTFAVPAACDALILLVQPRITVLFGFCPTFEAPHLESRFSC